MTDNSYDQEAKAISDVLPTGPRIAIIGSQSFWGRDSRDVCEVAARILAGFDGLVLLTGGVPGVGEAVGRSYVQERKRVALPCAIYHILLRGSARWD